MTFCPFVGQVLKRHLQESLHLALFRWNKLSSKESFAGTLPLRGGGSRLIPIDDLCISESSLTVENTAGRQSTPLIVRVQTLLDDAIVYQMCIQLIRGNVRGRLFLCYLSQ